MILGKIFRYGCGGLVALVVLVVIISAFTGGDEEVATDSQSGGSGQSEQNQAGRQTGSGDQGSDPAAAEEDQPGNQEHNEQPVAGIGEPVQVGEVQWTVTGAESTNQLTAEFQELKQGDFVIVNFSFTNNGTEAKTLDSESMTLIDTQGREFQADTDTFMYIDPSQDVFLEQVNPGVTRDGTVIYTTAPDASGFQLKVGDADFFSSESARVDLGF